jgi:hypothetical protein
MTLSDYILDTVLVLLVVRQIRESRWDRRAVLLPLGITAFVGHSYLHTVPTGGANLWLVAGLTMLGAVFGTVSALTTRVRTDGGRYALVRASWIAAGTWVLSMGGRFAFALWASHGGGPTLARFTVHHHLSGDVWVAALVLMALAEVVTRVGLVSYRAHRAVARQSAAPQRQLLTV